MPPARYVRKSAQKPPEAYRLRPRLVLATKGAAQPASAASRCTRSRAAAAAVAAAAASKPSTEDAAEVNAAAGAQEILAHLSDSDSSALSSPTESVIYPPVFSSQDISGIMAVAPSAAPLSAQLGSGSPAVEKSTTPPSFSSMISPDLSGESSIVSGNSLEAIDRYRQQAYTYPKVNIQAASTIYSDTPENSLESNTITVHPPPKIVQKKPLPPRKPRGKKATARVFVPDPLDYGVRDQEVIPPAISLRPFSDGHQRFPPNNGGYNHQISPPVSPQGPLFDGPQSVQSGHGGYNHQITPPALPQGPSFDGTQRLPPGHGFYQPQRSFSDGAAGKLHPGVYHHNFTALPEGPFGQQQYGLPTSLAPGSTCYQSPPAWPQGNHYSGPTTEINAQPDGVNNYQQGDVPFNGNTYEGYGPSFGSVNEVGPQAVFFPFPGNSDVSISQQGLDLPQESLSWLFPVSTIATPQYVTGRFSSKPYNSDAVAAVEQDTVSRFNNGRNNDESYLLEPAALGNPFMDESEAYDVVQWTNFPSWEDYLNHA